MTTAYTSLLGLALPVTGELSGTWGDTVNNAITSLLDSAVAGTTNISTDGDVTLTTTTGAANQAREAILLFSGARTALRTVTAPAQSKIYTVINATTGGYAVKLVGSGPTTGLTIPNGASATVAWNGSDFIEIGTSSIGNLTVNGNLTVTGTSTLTGAITNTAGTANGVAYLNGSKVVTSGSALTFDGTNFVLGANKVIVKNAVGDVQGLQIYQAASDVSSIFNYYNGALAFGVNNAEQMRLTSTGLGIGTSSPGSILDIVGSGNPTLTLRGSAGAYTAILKLQAAGGGSSVINATGASSDNLQLQITGATKATLDSSGNLGLGVTPSAWGANFRALQLKDSSNLHGVFTSGNGATEVGSNYYNNGTNDIYTSSWLATKYRQLSGVHSWYTTATGTAGNAITFTQAMTLTASSELLINRTSASGLGKLNVEGGADFTAGNVLIGRDSGNLLVGTTSNPDTARLHVTKSSGEVARFSSPNGTSSYITLGRSDTAGEGFQFGYSSSTGDCTITASIVTHPIIFKQSTTERARIDSSGNFTIGGQSSTRLEVNLTENDKVELNAVDSTNTARNLTFSIGDTERARIDTSGNLLVGTTSSLSSSTNRTDLSVNGVDTAIVSLGVGGARKGYFYTPGSGIIVAADGANPLSFWTNSAEVARIDSSGNFLVGTTSATGAGASVGQIVTNFNGAVQNGMYVSDTRTSAGTDNAINFGRGATLVGRLDTTLTSLTLTNLSDQRVKTNVQDSENALGLVGSVKVRQFDWTIDNSHENFGFVAQELNEVLPQAVSVGKTEEEMWGVNFVKLVPILTKAIQEQQAIIESLKARLDAANL